MPNDHTYRSTVAGLRLLAAPAAVQLHLLPSFVHVPDEILLAVDEVDVGRLLEGNRLSDAAKAALAELDSMLGKVEVDADDYEGSLRDVQEGEAYEALRQMARHVLELLGEAATPVELPGVVTV